MARVLNVPVTPGVLNTWAEWLAPPQQPFFLTAEEAGRPDLDTRPRAELAFSPEGRDTFALWNVHKPSQSWRTPRVVLPAERLKSFSRTRGWRLQRSRLSPVA